MVPFADTRQFYESNGYGSFLVRLINQTTKTILKSVLPTSFQLKWVIDPKFSDAVESFSNAFGIGAGVEGIFDPLQVPPNVHMLYPYTKDKSKLHMDLTLPKEFEDFMNKFNATAYISFGTTINPTERTLQKILSTIKSLPHVGFIFSLKAKE